MNNTISENVGICNRDDSCGAAGKIFSITSLKQLNILGLHWQDGGEGAIYGYGMTNDFINNRMTGYMHGFWVPVRDLQMLPSIYKQVFTQSVDS